MRPPVDFIANFCRLDVWATKAIRGNLMKKVYTIFIKKEERYDRSRGHR